MQVYVKNLTDRTLLNVSANSLGYISRNDFVLYCTCFKVIIEERPTIQISIETKTKTKEKKTISRTKTKKVTWSDEDKKFVSKQMIILRKILGTKRILLILGFNHSCYLDRTIKLERPPTCPGVGDLTKFNWKEALTPAEFDMYIARMSTE